MTIGCPRCFSVALASARRPTSVEPPGGQGTMRVTGRVGKFCAGAGGTQAIKAAMSPTTAPKALHFMAFPSVTGRYCGSPEDVGRNATPDHFLPQSQGCVQVGIAP